MWLRTVLQRCFNSLVSVMDLPDGSQIITVFDSCGLLPMTPRRPTPRRPEWCGET
jgi:hypothetical protein